MRRMSPPELEIAPLGLPERIFREMGAYMKQIIAFGIVALAITACGDDRSAAPAAGAEAVVTTPATEPAPSTTVAVPAPTTTAAMPTTTLPETTTTIATEDAIKQAVQDYMRAYHACGVAPANCAPDDFTATAGHSRAVITEFVAGLIEDGLYFSTETRGSRVVAESATVQSPTTASAVYCVFDAGTVLGPNGPDNLPTIVNDEAATIRDEFQLFMEDGTWRVGEKNQLERL